MRYFNIKNKNTALSILSGHDAKLIFKEECLPSKTNQKRKSIQDELQKRNFDIPGIDIEFYINGTDKTISIACIECHTTDIRLVSDYSIRYKGFVMTLFEDNSGSLEVYCGKDWESDRHEFLHTQHHHREMNGMSRIVLQYDTNTGYVFQATDDCRRGHYPTGSEPLSYGIDAAESIILDGLDKLLDHIKSHPEQSIDANLFTEPMPVTLKNESPLKKARIFTNLDDYKMAEYEHQTDRNAQVLEVSWRLLSLGVTLPEHPLAYIMHDGFIHCDVQLPNGERQDNIWHSNSGTTVEVKLTSMNNVYVVDAAACDRYRDEWFKNNPEARQMSNESYKELCVARAMTMVPINDYDGSFEKPVVLIGRPLTKKEIIMIEHSVTT